MQYTARYLYSLFQIVTVFLCLLFIVSVAFLDKVVLTLRHWTRLQNWFYHSNALDSIPISTQFRSNITDSGTNITSSGYQKHYITFISSLTASISQWTSFISVMWFENYNNAFSVFTFQLLRCVYACKYTHLKINYCYGGKKHYIRLLWCTGYIIYGYRAAFLVIC